MRQVRQGPKVTLSAKASLPFNVQCSIKRASLKMLNIAYKNNCRALMISVALLWVLTGCAIIAGLAIYATYWSCDPQSLGLIDNNDELVTFFVVDHLLHFFGLPGLVIAAILSGSLR